MKQVLINLLSNAIKYNREQGAVEVKCALSGPERVRKPITINEFMETLDVALECAGHASLSASKALSAA